MYTIRPAQLSDAPALLAVYRPYVEETYISFEYEVPSLEEFTRRIQTINERYPYLLAEQDGAVLGYAYAAPFKARAAYDWAVETTIYLRQDQRGRGIGRALYTELERQLRERGIQNMEACIAYPHPESIAFHTALGFRMVGRFEKCGYKLGDWRDMVWMEKHIGSHPLPPVPVRG